MSDAFSFLYAFLLMLGVLIFIHELGHFAVAKACGVRVLKFSLGFGSPIGFGRYRLRLHVGGTEYVIAWIPLGGYVKMLGEDLDGEEDAAGDDERAFHRRPIWQRLAILFAGPGMNLLLPVFLLVGSYAVGVERAAPVVGSVAVDSPAWRADLREGDRLTAVAGEPVRDWRDVAEAFAARPGREIPVAYERGGAPGRATVQVAARPGRSPTGSAERVGWSGLEHRRFLARIGVPDPQSPAARAGLRSGDLIVALDGEAVASWGDFVRRYRALPPGVTARLGVAAAEEEESLREGQVAASREIDIPALGDVDASGLLPALVRIETVLADSPAEIAGLAAGDLLLRLDGRPIRTWEFFLETVQGSGGRSLALDFARGGQLRHVEVSPVLKQREIAPKIFREGYQIGFGADLAFAAGAVVLRREVNPLRSIPLAIGETADTVGRLLWGLGDLLFGDTSIRELSGPIGIAFLTQHAFEQGWSYYLQIMVLISINLAILNLLPIPVLDGGQALLVLIEAVKGSPLSLRSREIALQIGIVMVGVLMIFAFGNDLSNLWYGLRQ